MRTMRKTVPPFPYIPLGPGAWFTVIQESKSNKAHLGAAETELAVPSMTCDLASGGVG